MFIFGVGGKLQGVDSAVLHRSVKRLIDQAMTIEQVLALEGIRYDYDFQMIHRAGLIDHGDGRIRHGAPDVLRQCLFGNQ